MERRRFLTAIGGGGATLLGGAGFLFLRPTKPVALPTEPLLYFTPREFAIFTAIADALIETPADIPGKPHCPSIYEAKLAQKADTYMASNVIDAQNDFHTLLGLF